MSYDPAKDAHDSFYAAIEAKRLRGDKHWPDRFGRLVVIGASERDSRSRAMCRVRCDCGEERTVRFDHLKSGAIKSCGCLSRELAGQRTAARKTHGLSLSPAYRSWVAMIQRCENENSDQYGRYGAKGIAVCRRWRLGEGEKGGFDCFLEDMGPRPSRSYSIDRFPNQAGNYEPGNCRWATSKEQNRNLRSNRIVVFDGAEMSLAEACERAGIRYKLARDRLARGWSIERALGVSQ